MGGQSLVGGLYMACSLHKTRDPTLKMYYKKNSWRKSQFPLSHHDQDGLIVKKQGVLLDVPVCHSPVIQTKGVGWGEPVLA